MQNVYRKIVHATVNSYGRHIGHHQLSIIETDFPELVTLFMTEVFKVERHSPRRGDNYVVREKSSKSNGSVIR